MKSRCARAAPGRRRHAHGRRDRAALDVGLGDPTLGGKWLELLTEIAPGIKTPGGSESEIALSVDFHVA
jgi:hypothetical protein